MVERPDKQLWPNSVQSSAPTSEIAHLRSRSVFELLQTRASTAPDPPFLVRRSVVSYVADRPLRNTGRRALPGRRGGAKAQVGGAARSRRLLSFRRPRRAVTNLGSAPFVQHSCICAAGLTHLPSDACVIVVPGEFTVEEARGQDEQLFVDSIELHQVIAASLASKAASPSMRVSNLLMEV